MVTPFTTKGKKAYFQPRKAVLLVLGGLNRLMHSHPRTHERFLMLSINVINNFLFIAWLLKILDFNSKQGT